MLCLLTSALAIDVTILRPAAAGWKRTQCGGATGTTDLPTKWASQVSPSEPPLPEYPRPTLVRSPHGIFDRDKGDDTTWRTLNGLWEWQPAASATAPPPFGQTLAGSILVPFPIESCLSGGPLIELQLSDVLILGLLCGIFVHRLRELERESPAQRLIDGHWLLL